MVREKSLEDMDKLGKDYDKDFNSQLTDQQKIIVGKFDKPEFVVNSKNGVYYSQTRELRAELDAIR